jgi:hypothetical protein
MIVKMPIGLGSENVLKQNLIAKGVISLPKPKKLDGLIAVFRSFSFKNEIGNMFIVWKDRDRK